MAKEPGWDLHVEHFPQRELRHLPTFAKELLAGGLAGGLSKTCTAPLERVKILFQTDKMVGNSISRTLWSILREEGWQGWYRGNGASVLRIVPYAAFNFGAYEQYRALLAQRLYGSEAARHHIPPVLDLLAGSAAGGTAVLLTYPLDLVRTRLAYGAERPAPQQPPSAGAAVGRDGSRGEASGRSQLAAGVQQQQQQQRQRLPKPSIRSVLSETARAGGVRGLYRGIGPTLLGIVPYAGLKFYIYQSMKQYYWQLHPPTGGTSGGRDGPAGLQRRLPVALMLSFGAASGVVAQTATYPLDVVRRKMQVQGLWEAAPGQQRITSTWAGLAGIVRAQGARALFAGLSINYLKVVPATAIGFTVYDAAKHYLDLPQNL